MAVAPVAAVTPLYHQALARMFAGQGSMGPFTVGTNINRTTLTDVFAPASSPPSTYGAWLAANVTTILPGQGQTGMPLISQGQNFLGWALFPVVFVAKTIRQVDVVPYAVVITSERWTTGSADTAGGTTPLHESSEFVPFNLATGVTVNVDISYIANGKGARDTILSLVGSLSQAQVPNGAYVYLFPYVSTDQYNQRRQMFGGVHGKDAWSFNGASLGLATFMAGMGAFPLLYTGYLNTIGITGDYNQEVLTAPGAYASEIDAQRLARYNRDQAMNPTQAAFHPKYSSVDYGSYRTAAPIGQSFKGSNFIEAVEEIPFKIALALAMNAVIMIPAKTQYNTDMDAAARQIAFGMSRVMVNTAGQRANPGSVPAGASGLPRGSSLDVLSMIRNTEMYTSVQLAQGISYANGGYQVLIAATGLEATVLQAVASLAILSGWNPNPGNAPQAIAAFQQAIGATVQKTLAPPRGARPGTTQRQQYDANKRLASFNRFVAMIQALAQRAGGPQGQLQRADAHWAGGAPRRPAPIGPFATAQQAAQAVQAAVVGAGPVLQQMSRVPGGAPAAQSALSAISDAAVSAAQEAGPTFEEQRDAPSPSALGLTSGAAPAASSVPLSEQSEGPAFRRGRREEAGSGRRRDRDAEEGYTTRTRADAEDDEGDLGQPGVPGTSAGSRFGDDPAHAAGIAAGAFLDSASHPLVLSAGHPAVALGRRLGLMTDALDQHYGTGSASGFFSDLFDAAKPHLKKAAGAVGRKVLSAAKKKLTGKSSGARNLRGNKTATGNKRGPAASNANKRGKASAIRRAAGITKKRVMDVPPFSGIWGHKSEFAKRPHAAMKTLFRQMYPSDYDSWMRAHPI
jgi:hypothetical protein